MDKFKQFLNSAKEWFLKLWPIIYAIYLMIANPTWFTNAGSVTIQFRHASRMANVLVRYSKYHELMDTIINKSAGASDDAIVALYSLYQAEILEYVNSLTEVSEFVKQGEMLTINGETDAVYDKFVDMLRQIKRLNIIFAIQLSEGNDTTL